MTGLWGFVIIGGPILLGLALLIAKWLNRNVPPPDPKNADRTPPSYEDADKGDP
jgi:hypothetical protein